MAHCFSFSSTVLRAPLTRGYLEGFLLHYYKQDNYFGVLFFFFLSTEVVTLLFL